MLEKVARKINDKRIVLAKLAVEETDRDTGRQSNKESFCIRVHFITNIRMKKHAACWKKINHTELKKIATPIGIIAELFLQQTPTSTAAFKILLALKTRNAIILSPHQGQNLQLKQQKSL